MMHGGTGFDGVRFGLVPRYYFHIFDDLDARDEEGVELRNVGEAKAYATHAARHLMSESLQVGGKINLDHRIVVQDERNSIVATIRYRDAVLIEG